MHNTVGCLAVANQENFWQKSLSELILFKNIAGWAIQNSSHKQYFACMGKIKQKGVLYDI